MFATEERTDDVFCLHSIRTFCGILNISGSIPQGRNLATQKSLEKKWAKLPKAHFAVHEYLVWNQYHFGRLYIITKTFMSSNVNSSAEPWTHKHISFYASWRCALSQLEITEENAHYFTGLRGFCVLAYLDIFQLHGFYIYIPRPQSGKISNSNTVILKLFEGNARKCKMILTSYCSQT